MSFTLTGCQIFDKPNIKHNTYFMVKIHMRLLLIISLDIEIACNELHSKPKHWFKNKELI